jgi:Domain of unknown function (DUF6458)
MTIGAGIFLLAVGAILRYAVEDELSAIDIPTVGLILMIAGAVGLVIGLFQTFGQQGQQPPQQPPRY